MADLCFPKGPPHFFLIKAPEPPPDDAVSEDRTHLDDFEGWMTKQSVRGFWQQRYFALNNGYLNYYADKTRPALLGSLDLSKVSLNASSSCGRSLFLASPMFILTGRRCCWR